MEAHTSLLGSKQVRGFFDPSEFLDEDEEEEDVEEDPE